MLGWVFPEVLGCESSLPVWPLSRPIIALGRWNLVIILHNYVCCCNDIFKRFILLLCGGCESDYDRI